MTDADGASARTLRRRPKVGIYLPSWTGGLDAGRAPRWPELRSLARLIEDVGFDSLWVADEFRYVFDDGDAIAYWESATILGAAAAVTSRVELGPLVAAVGFRNPALLARMTAALDEISDGRAALGLGAGYDEAEHRAHGFEWEHRVSRLEEAASIISQLLRTGHVDHQGRFFQLRDVVLEPRGPRPDGPPMIIGTISIGPRLMRCVARFADGWNGWLAFDDNRPSAVRPHRETLDAACREVGRDPASLRRTVGISIAMSDARFGYGPFDLSTIALRGTSDEVAATLAAFADEGIDDVMVYAFPLTPAAIEGFAPVLERLDAGGR
jgi:alkanesulfonate monooxygenase SsuD/methylene tetrahydromethanopterin reductase-like flavin-dependent oxidoreductase (luciferase family)